MAPAVLIWLCVGATREACGVAGCYALRDSFGSPGLSCRLSPGGTWLAMGTQKGTEVADLQSGFTLWSQQTSGAWVTDVAFSSDGRHLAIATGWGSGEGTKVVDLVDKVTVWEHASKTAYSVNFSPDGTKVISGREDGTVNIYEASSGAVLMTLRGGQATRLRRVRYSPDGTFIVGAVVYESSNTVKIWDAANGNLLHSLSHGDWVWDVRVSPDSTLVASTSKDGTVVIWKTDGTKVRTFSTGNMGNGVALVFSLDGTRLFVGVYGGIQEWDVSTGLNVATLSGSLYSWYHDLALSPDGSDIVSAVDGRTSYLVWDFLARAPPFAHPTSAPTPAPVTPAPPTPIPPTPAPPTPAPPTPSPPTPAPPTPAPPTPIPPTSAPPTIAPTPAPPTPAPPTPSPPTIVPTPAPPTAAPATPSPPTPAPATDAPATPAPPTLSPPTPAPATDAPATPAPATLAPVTTAPATTGPAGTAAPAAATTPAASGTPATLPADTPVPKASSAPPPVTATPEPAAVPLNDTCLAESQADCEALPLCVWDTAAPQCTASFDCTRVADTLCAQTEGCVWDADAAVCRAAAPRHGSSSSTCTLCWVLPVCGAALLPLCAAAFLLFCRKQKPRHRLELETFGKGDLFDAALMEMGGADQAPEEQGNPPGMDDDVTLLE